MLDVRELYRKERESQWAAWIEAGLPSRSSGRQGQRVIRASPSNAAGGGLAQRAMAEARTLARWDAESGYETDESRAPMRPGALEPGHVRLVIVPDEFGTFEDMAGDSFNPDVNPEIPRERLEREAREFESELNRVGVWGCIAETWNGTEWEHVDSCFGFEGPGMYGNPQPGWEASGMANEARCAALERLDSVRERNARALEATRPDMYGTAALYA